MKLTIKNIGKIKEAEIDLDKQLTVFFGPNNTGKTYVNYCIYGMYGQDFLNALHTKILKIDDKNSSTDKFLKVSLIETLLPQRESIKEKYIEIRNSFLQADLGNYDFETNKSLCCPNFLNSDGEFVEHIENIEKNSIHEFSDGISKTKYDGINLRTFVPSDSPLFKAKMKDEEVLDFLKIKLIGAIFETTFNYLIDCWFIPAERIGISVFSKEIGGTRLEKANNPNAKNSIYPKAINDALINSIQLDPKKKEVAMNILANEIEQIILGGKIHLDDFGNVYFSDDKIKNLPLLNSASTIKSLASLVLFLRYDCRKGYKLIIDEPEINLHPENQIKIARVLAKLSNMGVKVIVSTHSDYIIREFNNLIMLGSSKEYDAKLFEKYTYTKEEILDYKTVGAYHFNNGKVNCINVLKEGFEVESIDDVIINQNNATTEIRWSLKNKISNALS